MQRLGSESCCCSSAIWNTNDGRSSRNGHRILCVLGHFWALDTILCVWEIIVSIAENESGTGLLHSHSREEGPRDTEEGPRDVATFSNWRRSVIGTLQHPRRNLCPCAPPLLLDVIFDRAMSSSAIKKWVASAIWPSSLWNNSFVELSHGSVFGPGLHVNTFQINMLGFYASPRFIPCWWSVFLIQYVSIPSRNEARSQS